MISKVIKNELIMMLPGVIILDFVIYAVSVIFLGLNYSMALGLLLGTVVLYSYLILLGISTEDAIARYKLTRSEKSAKKVMLIGYFLRYLIVGIAVYISFSLKFGFLFNTIGVVVPMLYPKLIYVIKAIFNKQRKGE